MPLVVLDAFGACSEYVTALRSQETPVGILQPRTTRVTIGGTGRLARCWRLAGAVPSMVTLVLHLRAALRRLRPRAVWTNSPKALFVLARAVSGRVPILWHIHGRHRRPIAVQRRDWRKVAVVVGVSRASLDGLQHDGFRGRTEVVYNGIDIDAVVSQAGSDSGRLPGGDDELRIVMPASLIPLKNHSMAIHGLADYIRRGGRARLWVCGDNPDASNRAFVEDLRRLPGRLGIEGQVDFLGWRENVPAVLARADAMLLTSNTEGLPLSLLESMCLGRPVVATRVGGIPELVRDGVDGFLVDVGDVSGVSRALAALADRARRAEMGRQATARIKESFTLRQQTRAFARVLASLPRAGRASKLPEDVARKRAVGLAGPPAGDVSA